KRLIRHHWKEFRCSLNEFCFQYPNNQSKENSELQFQYPKKKKWTRPVDRVRVRTKKRKKGSKSSSSSVSEFLFDGFLEPSPGIAHQLGAQSEHENAKLHLIQRAVAVHIPFLDHPGDLPVRQVLETQNGGVSSQALRRDHPFVLVHQQLEPIAELLN
ncbi:unnamed protein product, partial [Linum tenue]